MAVNPNPDVGYTTRHGRQVHFTDRMQGYLQQQERHANVRQRHDTRNVMSELQEEINRTELEIKRREQELRRTQSMVATSNPHRDVSETSVKQRYGGHDIASSVHHPLFTSSPATATGTVPPSSAERNQTWPSAIPRESRVSELDRTFERVVDVSHLVKTSTEEPEVFDTYQAPPLSDYHHESISLPEPGLGLVRTPDKPVQPSDSDSLLYKLADLLSNRRESLPKMEPEIFSGDLLRFPVWIKSFNAIIESHTESPSERLFFLSKYTSGAAREAIDGFFSLDSDDAYTQAKDTLTSRYGDRYKVSEAFKKKLNSWPVIRPGDAEGLRKFSDFLQHCNSAMTSITYLESLNSAEENRKLIEKLPRYMTDRWNRVIDRWLYGTETEQDSYLLLSTGHYPPFSAFCKFIANEARIACGPGNVYSTTTSAKKSAQEQSGQQTKPAKKKAGSFVSQATVSTDTNKSTKESPATSTNKATVQQQCLLCKNQHTLDKCQEFLGKSGEDKKSFASSHGLCFGCLRRGHMFSSCRRKNSSLMKDGAAKKDGSANSSSTAAKEHEKYSEDRPASNTAVSHRIDARNVSDTENGCIHSMIMPVVLHHTDNPNKKIQTYALLDNQSDTCFIREGIMQELDLTSETVTLELTTVLAKQVVESQVARGLVVTGLDQDDKIPLPATYSRSNIPANKNLIPRPETVHQWPHLRDVPVHPLQEDTEIGLLIGINCSRALLPREIIAEGDDDPYAVRTSLGWGVTGNMCSSKVTAQGLGPTAHFAFRTSAKEITPLEVRQMLEQEFNERQTDKQISVQDAVFLKKMEDGMSRRDDGHIELPLPLKDDNLSLPNNKLLAVKRLNSLKRKMVSNDRYRQDYTKFMDNLMDKGFAEKVPVDQEPDTCIWYIPHHGVYHPKKLDKIRVVFDCSAQYRDQSLNQNLLSGPDLINNLTGVLLRFRKEPVAITCDIEAMFHQVAVSEEYRDLLRFLWWEGGDLSKPPTEYRMTVHLFGATSSPGCANYALKYVANTDVPNGKAGKFIQDNFYVDDGLTSVPTTQEALTLIESSRALCESGGFNLTKFISNSKEVVESLPPEIRAKDVQNIDLCHDSLPVERTLGVQWCVESDAFQFHVTLQDKPMTRRGLLSSISSIFDPLGLISPFLLTAKKLLQELCRNNADWDDPLPEDIMSRWRYWRSELLTLSKLQIPRCYKTPELGDVKRAELHHFSDASQEAYGQCSYLRLIDNDDQVSSSLVLAKSRVAPLKTVTIPRMELTAAVTSVKVSTFLNEELNYDDITHFYWTDSTVVLGYISNEARRFHIYVANRVQQIRNGSSNDQWNYINTKHNPADIASRGVSAKQLLDNTTWWKGPAFLSTAHPIHHSPIDATLSENDPEVKKVTVHSTSATSQSGCDLLQRLSYFSTWYRAKRAIAVCIKFIRRLRERTAQKRVDTRAKSTRGGYSTVTVDELQHAEKIILRLVQHQEFPDEVELLSQQGKLKGRNTLAPLTKRRSPLHRLDPYMGTDGLLRVGGRVQRANVPRELAHPVILPKRGHVTTLIIRHHHERTRHGGRGTTLNEIRASGFWIIKIRTVVTSYVWRCVTCKKLRGTTAGQKMADLPADRLEPAPPFTNCGVDMFGPFYVREGRSDKKRWGCMFTCMATRAIHIEVTHSLSTDSFLHAYRRFVGRRGPVRQIRCDQGTNFVGAKNELQAALNEMDHTKVQRELSQDGCDWVQFKMNVPKASHMGGVWERLIRSARTVLCALLDQHGTQLDDETLETFMVEAEAVVNGRPLTYLEDDKEPLTPSQLLTLKSKVVLPLPGKFVKEDLFSRRRWRRIQHLANEFWSRWRKEYLPTLQERAKWTNPESNLQTGDIVLMTAEDVPRGQWPKAIVVNTYPSEDGFVRKVTIKTSTATLDRPIHKLVLLYRPGIPTKEPDE